MILILITVFVDLVHLPEFEVSRKHDASKNDYLSAFRRREGDVYSVGSFTKS
jgi:hypothetical protein